jgi:hypothetical protein
VPLEHKTKAAAIATDESKKNSPILPRKLAAGVSIYPLKLAMFTGKMWADGRQLDVHFLDGSKVQRRRVAEHAITWSRYANLSLNFGARRGAEVRISFSADPGSWSAIGTDCLVREAFPASAPTMNLGWLRDDTEDVEFRRVVLHEFGHVLAAIHEHQSPKGGIKWNVPEVYRYFSGPPNNWSRAEIRSNILDKYSQNQLNGTSFDIKSIMLYSFPSFLIVGGHATPNNTALSAGDRRFATRTYPRT